MLTHLLLSRQKKIKNFPFWYSRETIYLYNEKRKYHKRWRTFQNSYDYERFSHFRSECGFRIKADYLTYISDCEESIISSPKNFWSYIDFNKIDSAVPVTIQWEGSSSLSKQEASEVFADKNNLVPLSCKTYGVKVHSLSVSYDEVYERLRELKDDSSSGPDGIPPIVLKNCAFSLTIPLTVLFHISLQSGTFPSAWKISYIKPIFKSGDKNQASNYRPISKNSIIAQIFDNIVATKLISLVSTLLFSSMVSLRVVPL